MRNGLGSVERLYYCWIQLINWSMLGSSRLMCDYTGAQHLKGKFRCNIAMCSSKRETSGSEWQGITLLCAQVHPFLMVFGFVFMAGEAIMVYRMVPAERNAQKFVHMALHLVAITLGIVGIYAVFKFHKMSEIENMFSLHSWLGMITFCLYGLQWLFGFFIFWFPRASDVNRQRIHPWHMFFGRVLLYMAIITAETGLTEKATITQLEGGTESRLMNFTGLFILLFGLAVDVSINLSFL